MEQFIPFVEGWATFHLRTWLTGLMQKVSGFEEWLYLVQKFQQLAHTQS